MAKRLYDSVNGVARKVTKKYDGVDGVARKVVKAYDGVDGVARQYWPSVVTVTFDSNGGASVASQTIEPGTCATNPGAISKTNYTFMGWRIGSPNGEVFDFSTLITDDITLYAHWGVTVTFSTTRGTTPAAQVLEIGGKATEPAELTADGYVFRGWSPNTSYSSYYNFNTAVTTNITLYAAWSEIVNYE